MWSPASATHRRPVSNCRVPETFGGFPPAAFDFFERVQPDLPWSTVHGWQEEWSAAVHEPMEALLAALAPEFGDGYAWHLHRDPWLWRHQVAGVASCDTIGLRLVLSVAGLQAAGGWARSDSAQVARYRAALRAGAPGAELAAIVAQLRAGGFAIDGHRLARGPAGFGPDHPRLELARYRTLTASAWVDPLALSGPGCLPAVAACWGALLPLIRWLTTCVGPRDGRG
jgi:Conserved hypothetical protein (DUF2461)